MKITVLFYEEVMISNELRVKYMGTIHKAAPILRSVINDPFPGLSRRLKVVAIDRVSSKEAHVIV